MPEIKLTKGLNSLEPSKIVGGLGTAPLAKSVNLESGKVCRICLDEEDHDDPGENPFITPCGCQGSMKFIHVNCVREWLDAKKQSQKLDGVYSYYWEELSCELCKEPLKLRNEVAIRHKGSPYKYTKQFFLLNYKVPSQARYMVIESDINCLSKAIHVIDFDHKKEYTVGRRVTNDVTVSDISVSRAQSSIKLRRGKVYVEDLDSKFGTFVKVRGTVEIDQDWKRKGRDSLIPIQVEKKCFFIKPVNRYSWMWRQCCLCLCPNVKRPLKSSNKYKTAEQQYQFADTDFDHYQDVTEKYPDELHE